MSGRLTEGENMLARRPVAQERLNELPERSHGDEALHGRQW
jgi:hypothetical protein